MRLILGGSYQGKLAYALGDTGLSEADVRDGDGLNSDGAYRARLINRFHLLIKNVLSAGENAEAFAHELAEKNPGLVIICDEIGMGVVPVDAFERAWREDVGRALCILASGCERVDRVYYGIPTRIK